MIKNQIGQTSADCAGENKSQKMILHDRHTSTLGDVTLWEPFGQVWYTKHHPGSHIFEVCQLEEEPSLVDSWNLVLFSDLLLQKGPFREISSPLMCFLWSVLAGPCHVAVNLYSWTGLLPCGREGALQHFSDISERSLPEFFLLLNIQDQNFANNIKKQLYKQPTDLIQTSLKSPYLYPLQNRKEKDAISHVDM